MFYCNNCGKRGVNKLGDWCDECLEEIEEYREYDEGLCTNCEYNDGEGNCRKYKMYIWMVKRKYKCKYFKEAEHYVPPDW